jgi:hypothetical protein
VANEGSFSGSLQLTKSSGKVDVTSFGPTTYSPSSVKSERLDQTIGTSDTALNLGGLTPGYVAIINRDPTNYVEVKTASGGIIFGKLFPGEGMMLRLGSGAQIPVAIANSAPVQIELQINAA